MKFPNFTDFSLAEILRKRTVSAKCAWFTQNVRVSTKFPLNKLGKISVFYAVILKKFAKAFANNKMLVPCHGWKKWLHFHGIGKTPTKSFSLQRYTH